MVHVCLTAPALQSSTYLLGGVTVWSLKTYVIKETVEQEATSMEDFSENMEFYRADFTTGGGLIVQLRDNEGAVLNAEATLLLDLIEL